MERQPYSTNRVSKLEDFLTGLQRSWEEVTKSMEAAQEIMKKQFDKK